MPKRGGGNRGYQNNNNYVRFSNEHDEREEFGARRDNKLKGRRVSFKPTRGGPAGRGRFSEMAIRQHLDNDEEMDGELGLSTKHVRGRGPIRRRSSPPPRGGGGGKSFIGRRRLTAGTSGWFQVKIPFGAKVGKTDIYALLLQHIRPVVFIPHYYKDIDNASIFYVDDLEAAQKLSDSDRQIQMPSGHQMRIIVSNNVPQSNVDDTVVERMKLAMVKRYNAATKALDLTKFHSDPDLLDIFCALFRPSFMSQAFKIIGENIPQLEALNLNDNKINLMVHFADLPTKVPNLKILYLANNKIPTLRSMDALKGCGLVELMLDGNPFKDRLDPKVYVSEIRKIFPKLMKLDGKELPPAIGFDLEEGVKLPAPKASFLCDAAGADIVRQFLEQYFIIFDSESRQPLLDAYHEQAMFSLTIGNYQHGNQGKLSNYFNLGRNLLRIRDREIKSKTLKQGRLPVVTFLSELPETQHDPQSFAVDMTVFTPQMLVLTVTGVFKEKRKNSTVTHLRSFQRTMVVVPSGSGFCIRNEMLTINNPTPSQIDKSFKGPLAAAAVAVSAPSTPVVGHPGVAGGVQSPVAVVVDDNTKLQMVHAMTASSNMNLEWSRKCLEETNWDFQRAGFVFAELHKQGKIPPEAFVK